MLLGMLTFLLILLALYYLTAAVGAPLLTGDTVTFTRKRVVQTQVMSAITFALLLWAALS